MVDDLREAAPWPVPVPDRPGHGRPAGRRGHPARRAGRGLPRRAAPAAATTTLAMLASFAGQAALALERARAQEERELLVVLEDRERIARDLHDVVIQRLFATGLQLQSAAPHGRPARGRPSGSTRPSTTSTPPSATSAGRSSSCARRSSAVAAHRDPRRGRRGRRRRSGSGPTLEMSGPVDSAVPDEIRPDLLAVLREALSNVVRHARGQPGHGSSVRVDGGQVTRRR